MGIDLEKVANRLLTDFCKFSEEQLKLPRESFELLAVSILGGMNRPAVEAKDAGVGLEVLLAWEHFENLSPLKVFAMLALCPSYGFLKEIIAELRTEGPSTELADKLMSCAEGLGRAEAFLYTERELMEELMGESPEALKAAVSRLGTSGADARHSFNRSRKATWRAWYQAHKHLYPSKDAAAEVLADKADVQWRTAREWITEWGRSERSAGKP